MALLFAGVFIGATAERRKEINTKHVPRLSVLLKKDEMKPGWRFVDAATGRPANVWFSIDGTLTYADVYDWAADDVTVTFHPGATGTGWLPAAETPKP
jgi:hypothetical protein